MLYAVHRKVRGEWNCTGCAAVVGGSLVCLSHTIITTSFNFYYTVLSNSKMLFLFLFFFKSLRAKLLAGILIDFLRQCLLSTFLAAVLGPGQLAELVVGVCWRLHTEKSTQDGELAVTTR